MTFITITILSVYLLGASALEVESSDSSEVETVVLDVYCTGDNSNIMQCTMLQSVYTCYSQDVAVRCQGKLASNTCYCRVIFIQNLVT